MIKVELHKVANEDLFCPHFYCDACGKRIDLNTDGNYCGYYADGDTLVQPVYVAHKGNCTRALDSVCAVNGKLAMSWELKDLPNRLQINGDKFLETNVQESWVH